MVKPSTATLDVNDSDAIVKAIQDVLGIDEQARKQAEVLLKSTSKKDFNGYVLALTKLLKDNQADHIRMFCAVILKRFFSGFSEENENESEEGWTKAHSETQKFIKETLLELLQQTDLSSNIRQKVSTMTATVACAINRTGSGNKKKRLSKETTEWNELKQAIPELLGSNNENLAKVMLNLLIEIVDTEPGFLAKESSQILQTMSSILQRDENWEEAKQIALEGIGTFVGSYGKKAIKSEDVKEIGEAIFKYVTASVEEPTMDWKNVSEEADENGKVINEPEVTAIDIGMATIDSIIGSLPKKTALNVFSQLIFDLLKQNDWKYQHCALMFLSQSLEYIDDIAKFDPIINSIVNALQHEHPSVKYAALNCIGQAAEDHRPKFQEKYSETLLPLMIKMYTDETPRVAYHSLNATINFLEECPKDITSKFLEQILEPAISFVETGKYSFKQSAMTTIATLADSCKANFLPHWEKAYDVILKALNNIEDNMLQFKGQAIEALTLIAETVGRTEFNKVSEPLITKILEMHPDELEVGGQDILGRYLTASWGRVFLALKEDLTPYLSTVMPPVFELAKKLVSQDRQPEDEDFTAAFKTIANFFASGFKQEYVQYVKPTLTLFLGSIVEFGDKSAMNDATSFLTEIIESIDSSSYSDKHLVLKDIYTVIMALLSQTLQSTSDTELLECQLEIIRKLIPKVGKVMSETELQKFTGSLLQVSNDSQGRLTKHEEENNEDEEEDDTEDERSPIEIEQDLQFEIVMIFGALFKAYKEQTLPLVGIVNNVILPKALSSEASPYTTRLGLLFITNLIEYLGLELISEKVPYYVQTLIKHTLDSDTDTRNDCAYGLGVFAQLATSEDFTGFSDACMKAIYDALLIEREEDEEQSDFDHAHDNIIAALGKIIKYQHENIDANKAVKVWLGYLPLREDIDEAKEQHDIFVELLLGPNAELVFGEDGENLQKILQIIAELLDSNLVSDEFERKAAEAMEFLRANAATRNLVQEAISKLELKLQDKLKGIGIVGSED